MPLLEQEFVPTGWLTEQEFLAGYGAAQAVPGPLFTFAAYIGAVINGWQGGLFATFAIFLPAFLLILGTLPFWDALRRNPKIKGALIGCKCVRCRNINIRTLQSHLDKFNSSPNDFALQQFCLVCLLIGNCHHG